MADRPISEVISGTRGLADAAIRDFVSIRTVDARALCDAAERGESAVAERDRLKAMIKSFIEGPPAFMSYPGTLEPRLVPINSTGMREVIDEVIELRAERDMLTTERDDAVTRCAVFRTQHAGIRATWKETSDKLNTAIAERDAAVKELEHWKKVLVKVYTELGVPTYESFPEFAARHLRTERDALKESSEYWNRRCDELYKERDALRKALENLLCYANGAPLDLQDECSAALSASQPSAGGNGSS